MKLATQLLSDRRAGLVTDSDGRRWFRPRQVRFRTIRVRMADLLGSAWLGYELSLPPPDWSGEVPHAELRRFAHAASERFISFWYRVMDVAVARAIAGTDRAIFEEPFLEPGSLLDLGIPESQANSSVPPALHARLLDEYRHSRGRPSQGNVYYLSELLDGVADDVRIVLAPYRGLWLRRRRRRRLLQLVDRLALELRLALLGEGPDSVGARLQATLHAALVQALERAARERGERRVSSATVRRMIHRVRAEGSAVQLSADVEREVIRSAGELGLSRSVRALYRQLQLPGEIHRLARSAATLDANVHRLELRLARIEYLHRRYGRQPESENLVERRERYRALFERRLVELLEAVRSTEAREATRALRIGRAIHALLGRLAACGRDLIALYRTPREPAAADEGSQILGTGDARFPGAEHLILPAGLAVGDPHAEAQVLARARELLLRRLRPLRQSAGVYSVIPDHRHGAISLNPVMKLWKSRPTFPEAGEPGIASLQINTRETVLTLLELASLADPELAQRSVDRGRIARLGRAPETLETLRTVLLPGSCYPLREVRREDFPEFRGQVIGETRSPVELGVPAGERAILTGAWYKKKHHCLYYPIGGDNALLLRTIWRGARAPGPAAFFFALGQFVHDCLPDDLVYYRAGAVTFRECVEDYYRMEDRVRKNRGERFGRRHTDNTRAGVRFMFAVAYARVVLEILTGSSQSHFRHPMSERWFSQRLGLPVLALCDRSILRSIRSGTLACIRAADDSA